MLRKLFLLAAVIAAVMLSGGGVRPSGIVDFFMNLSYEASFITEGTVEDIKKELAKGAPVIVFIHTEEPYDNPHATHYVPAVVVRY